MLSTTWPSSEMKCTITIDNDLNIYTNNTTCKQTSDKNIYKQGKSWGEDVHQRAMTHKVKNVVCCSDIFKYLYFSDSRKNYEVKNYISYTTSHSSLRVSKCNLSDTYQADNTRSVCLWNKSV